ncbi:hypothetical protein [Natronorubrum sp. DTA7]|uniref:hypothetical protein n=1 Tax=Natronorubrum sp. DTA7 TaxID=3447016 RepID=UPI003F8499CA
MPDSICRRFGPGRLPYASRRDIGAGIAMAATGVLAITIWFVATGLLLLTDTVPTVTGTSDLGFAVAYGLLFAPFGVVTSFVAGTLCWRAVDADALDPITGALLGACTAATGMIGGSLGVSLVFTAVTLATGTLALGELLVFAVVISVSALLFSAVFAGWLIVPLGAFGGWYHERARATATGGN